jgi:hypothetical protein
MRAQNLNTLKYSFFSLAFFMIINVATVEKASAQVDHYYGQNDKGFRLGIGAGVGILATHYHANPAQIVGIGSLDYDFSPYLSIGLEAQAGYLKGEDKLNHLYYQTSKDQFLDANVNIRVAVGQFYDFDANNAFQDAIKRIYIGVGVGRIRTDNTFTTNESLAAYKPEAVKPILQMWAFPANFGTNIDLHVLGADRLTLNPNYQFSFVNDYYLDGYRTSVTYSHLKGFYNLVTLKLKYKF